MTANTQTKQGAKPIEKFNVGTVQVAIFRNEGKEGAFFKASIENSYKDGETWKTTNGYSSRDLVNLAKAALLAHSSLGKLSRAQQPNAANQSEEDETGE